MNRASLSHTSESVEESLGRAETIMFTDLCGLKNHRGVFSGGMGRSLTRNYWTPCEKNSSKMSGNSLKHVTDVKLEECKHVRMKKRSRTRRGRRRPLEKTRRFLGDKGRGRCGCAREGVIVLSYLFWSSVLFSVHLQVLSWVLQTQLGNNWINCPGLWHWEKLLTKRTEVLKWKITLKRSIFYPSCSSLRILHHTCWSVIYSFNLITC